MSDDPDARSRLWIACLMSAAGGAIVLMAVGAIPVDPADVFAPPWVVVGAGIVFVIGGVMAAAGRRWPRANDAAAALLIGDMAAIASWIAFGSGERQFSGGISIGPLGASGAQTPSVGRIVFGLSAALLWVLTLVALRRALSRP